MKKKFKLLSLIFFIGINILTLASCTNKQEQFLEITNDDIFISASNYSKLNDIANIQIAADYDSKKITPEPKCIIQNDENWKWNIENRKNIVGTTFCGYEISKHDKEKDTVTRISVKINWTAEIRKTNKKGLYLYSYNFKEQ